MRKYIVGFIVGLVMSIGITAYADEINSMIGKVVQGTFPVFINDERLDNEAIVIDGTSYLPVREVADRLGLEVEFELDKGVNLVSRTGKESVEESNIVEEIDNTPEIAGLLLSSPNNNLNVSYSWFDDPLGSIDQGIRTVVYDDVVLYSVDDFISVFGSEWSTGKPYFTESENGYTILKVDGITISYIKSNKKQAQVINDELYFNIKSYPKLPGYPPHKPTAPTPIVGNNPEMQSEGRSQLNFSPTLNQQKDIQGELDLINQRIADQEQKIKTFESTTNTDNFIITDEQKTQLGELHNRLLNELEDLKRQKAELEQLAP